MRSIAIVLGLVFTAQCCSPAAAAVTVASLAEVGAVSAMEPVFFGKLTKRAKNAVRLSPRVGQPK